MINRIKDPDGITSHRLTYRIRYNYIRECKGLRSSDFSSTGYQRLSEPQRTEYQRSEVRDGREMYRKRRHTFTETQI